VLLTESEPWITILFFTIFVMIIVVSAIFVAKIQHLQTIKFVRQHLHLSDQLPVRMSIFLIFFLVGLTIKLKLNVLLGAFSAGILVRLFISPKDKVAVESKLKAIGFGFLIPLFFIVTGIHFDLHSLASLNAMWRVLGFFVCLLIVRGVPVFLVYRGLIELPEQKALAFFSATGLPLIVAITQLGLMTHKIQPINAAALIGAGMLSVLVFPILGLHSLKSK